MLVNIANMDIKKKLTRLYNLEKLHSVARERIVLLEKENRQLKLRIKELEDQNKDRDTKLEAVSFQLEQIKIHFLISSLNLSKLIPIALDNPKSFFKWST